MSNKKNCIYLIDDNKYICNALAFAMESVTSWPVKTYHTSMKFLKIFNTDLAGCIVLDLFMPILDGLELILELKARKNKMPIIVMSGNSNSKSVELALKEGAFSFISKPFTVETLMAQINLAINHPTGTVIV